MTTKATLLHAVRQKCLDCAGYQPSEVRLCTVTACALWPFRLGCDPQPARRGFGSRAAPSGAAHEGGGGVAGSHGYTPQLPLPARA